MYEERREKFSFKSFFLTILLVLLFVFLMLWLFPTKWDVKDLQSTYDLERLSVLYDEIFANNVARMKDAAIGYFTNERMPVKIGETKKLTLQEMYDLHLVLKLKDKDGKPCDTEKSYVEMTKYENEYQLKVNLSCGDQEDYIIVYLGCYDYCDGICEKRVETTPEEPTNPDTPSTPDTPEEPTNPDIPSIPDTPEEPANPDIPSTPDVPDTPPSIVKKYMYEYEFVIEDKTTCTDWSEWGKDKIEGNDSVKVETKVENEIIDYKTVQVQTGTKKETIVTGQTTEKYIVDYLTELVVVDTIQIPTGETTTMEITEKVQVGTVEVNTNEIGTGSRVPDNTDTEVYKVISTDTTSSCSYCADETTYIWEIWSIEPVYDVVTRTEEVPVYKVVNVFEEKTTPVYDYKWVDVTEEIETPIYKDVKVPIYGDVTYYREQTCTFTKGSTTLKWSHSNMDSALIGNGYKLTGNVKEV